MSQPLSSALVLTWKIYHGAQIANIVGLRDPVPFVSIGLELVPIWRAMHFGVDWSLVAQLSFATCSDSIPCCVNFKHRGMIG